MRKGIACLILGYLFSQFYRSFLAVLTPALQGELGISTEDFASASGYWFLAFGAMQLPVGSALDRFGPRRVCAILLAVAALGAALFAMAEGPFEIKLAMTLIGAGCAPILVANYFIFAREFPPALFASLASVTIGLGSLGDMAASLPFAMAAEAWGWREALWVIAGLTLLMAGALWLLIRDPARVTSEGKGGSALSVLAIRPLWPILGLMLVCYAAPAGLRGLWLGPYFHDIWGFDKSGIGSIGLAMGLALVLASLLIGPLARHMGGLKRTSLIVNTLMMLSLVALCLFGGTSWLFAGACFIAVGFFGTSFPIITAHARGFIPAHLMGRGVTLVNLFGIASVGVAQQITGGIFATSQNAGAAPAESYALVFGFFALVTLLGLIAYLFAKEPAN